MKIAFEIWGGEWRCAGPWLSWPMHYSDSVRKLNFVVFFPSFVPVKFFFFPVGHFFPFPFNSLREKKIII